MGDLNITALLIGFAISQAVLIPVMMTIWRTESSRPIGPRPANAAILIILVFLSGLFVLHPMYRIDLDYIEAAKSVRANLSEDAKVIFSGKKDDADPFIFYSGMRGWALHPAKFCTSGWDVIEGYTTEGAEYFTIMKSNRYIQPGHEKYPITMSYIAQLEVVYNDALVTIYDLSGKPWEK